MGSRGNQFRVSALSMAKPCSSNVRYGSNQKNVDRMNECSKVNVGFEACQEQLEKAQG